MMLVKTQEENERLRGGQLINVATNSLVEKLREEKIDLEYYQELGQNNVLSNHCREYFLLFLYLSEILRTRIFNRYKQ